MNMLHRQISGPTGAPTLILLGSLGSTTAMWEPQLGALTEQLRVIRVDALGHGGSPVDPAAGDVDIADLGRDVLAVLDELGISRAHFAGLSLGGMTAMWLAAHAPDRVGRLALLCTTAHFADPRPWRDRAELVRSEGTGAIAEAVVGRWFTPALCQRDPELVARHRAMIDAADLAGYAQCCDAIATLDLRPDLPRIAAPTLVIAGAQDTATPPEHARVIASGIAGARLSILDPAAHLANVEQAGAVTALLLDHFAGDPRAAGDRTRRSILGDAHVDAAVANEFIAPFQDFLTRYAWGDVWSRPGLDRATRSAITLAALTALGAEHELGMHVRAALHNGLSRDQISEILLHTALYAGLPRSNRAFAIASRVLEEG